MLGYVPKMAKKTWFNEESNDAQEEKEIINGEGAIGQITAWKLNTKRSRGRPRQR